MFVNSRKNILSINYYVSYIKTAAIGSKEAAVVAHQKGVNANRQQRKNEIKKEGRKLGGRWLIRKRFRVPKSGYIHRHL